MRRLFGRDLWRARTGRRAWGGATTTNVKAERESLPEIILIAFAPTPGQVIQMRLSSHPANVLGPAGGVMPVIFDPARPERAEAAPGWLVRCCCPGLSLPPS